MMFPYLQTAIVNLTKKPLTQKFPDPEDMGALNYRGRIEFDAESCVDCGMCIKVCGPMAISREEEEVEGGLNITRSFDLTSCTFCGFCQDFCGKNSIRLTADYHMVATDAADLCTTGVTFKKKVLGKLICYQDNCLYCGLCMRNCPEKAITVDRKTKTWSVNHAECVKCGMCISKCPKNVLEFQNASEEGVIFSDSCIYCTLCAKKCPVGAITVDRPNKTWEIDRAACMRCGVCVAGCPKKALTIGPLDE